MHTGVSDWERSALGSDGEWVPSDDLVPGAGPRLHCMLYSLIPTALPSRISQTGNCGLKKSSMHEIIGLFRKWCSWNQSPRRLDAACGHLSQQHTTNLGCLSAAQVPMHTWLAELWACGESSGDGQRENTEKSYQREWRLENGTDSEQRNTLHHTGFYLSIK